MTVHHDRVHDATDRDGAAEEQSHADDITDEEQHLDGNSGRPRNRRGRIVVEHEAILHVQHRPVARKQSRIQVLNDGGNVERLIADAVAVAAAVQNGDEAECGGAGSERRPAGSDQ